ncbi:MAG: class I SAM-dependent methyltransferase [Anaerolineae bacterium]|nr:class I SAM-dependent methyltransferase [Anaerolineae bacterium]
MNEATRRRLNALNRDFYRTTAADFAATRGQAWAGWQPLLPHVPPSPQVLDVGCGNGRFGAFLAQHLPGPIAYHGVDNTPALLAYTAAALPAWPALRVTLTLHDIVEQPLPAGEADVVVLFGVLHHLPGAEFRRQMVQRLAARVRPGGLLALAAWCFYDVERFRARIVPWDAAFPEDTPVVEAGDYVLDWRRGERALRYCHYVDAAEQADLVAATGLTHLTTYYADGQEQRLNRYSLLHRAPA